MSGIAILWTITGVAVPVFVGLVVPLTMDGTSTGEFWAARVLLIFSAIWLGGFTVYWLSTTTHPLAWRLIAGALIGILIIAGTPVALRWVNFHAQTAPIRQTVDRISPLISIIGEYQNKLASHEQAANISKQILDQHKKIQNAIEYRETIFGTKATSDRLAAAEHIINEITMLLGNIHTNTLPEGDALIIRTAPNTFRVTFPVPMRIAPKLAFHDIPSAVIPNVVEKSSIGFTVVFKPSTISVETFGFEADAEL